MAKAMMRAHARLPRSFGNVKSVESVTRAKSVFKSDLTALKKEREREAEAVALRQDRRIRFAIFDSDRFGKFVEF